MLAKPITIQPKERSEQPDLDQVLLRIPEVDQARVEALRQIGEQIAGLREEICRLEKIVEQERCKESSIYSVEINADLYPTKNGCCVQPYCNVGIKAAATAEDKAKYGPRPWRWVCENPDCNKVFGEYINGCPACSARGLAFSVRAVDEINAPIIPESIRKESKA